MTWTQRGVEAELLDTLPPDDPGAVASRKDLRMINRLMGNFRWFANSLAGQGGGSCLELGAGDGALAYSLARSGKITKEHHYTGLDLLPAPSGWPWEWLRGDLTAFAFDRGHTLVLANLILHHFNADQLAIIGQRIRDSQVRHLLLCEPTRRPVHIWQITLSRILGIHPVTWHDARVSIRAGFRRDELAGQLGLSEAKWEITHTETFLGANRLVCTRR